MTTIDYISEESNKTIHGVSPSTEIREMESIFRPHVSPLDNMKGNIYSKNNIVLEDGYMNILNAPEEGFKLKKLSSESGSYNIEEGEQKITFFLMLLVFVIFCGLFCIANNMKIDYTTIDVPIGIGTATEE